MKKTAIVTGATRGIGLAIANRLQEDGYDVITMGRSIPQEDLGQTIFMQGDLSNHADRERLVAEALKINGQIDLLVNNAGIGPDKRVDLLETTEESYDKVMTVNLKAPYFLSQLVARQMVKQEQIDGFLRGVIVNIGSVSAIASSSNRGEYCLSKAAIPMMTELFATRFAEDGILVYEVRPGVIDTSILAPAAREKYAKLLEDGAFPIRRWGQPEDVSHVVATLGSGAMRYTTGQVINVDGGLMLQRL